ncbi:gliding motility-associated C-terminal domain-containing protein [Algoriphagus sp. 4150]|uniref:T9SS type B sorting domain-containing protein n=1 Tax=Algoriphagus sp. 4150 TaxID=2817756 RepID=UPI00286A5EE1|nr:gliding motility-associated C-terminal domain-containing protein [Algoriphagus sp. 4150]
MSFLLISIGAMMCFNSQAQTIIRVAPNGTGNGSSWAEASNIESAVANSSSNTEIWLRAGVYFLDQELELNNFGRSELAFYGGFSGAENSRNQRDFEENKSILDGQNSTRILFVRETNFTIDGVTLRNGFIGLESPDDINKGGGAIYIFGGHNTTILNCIFLSNISEGDRGAGAVYNRFGDNILVENCLFENNRFQNPPGSSNGGGAIFNWTDGLVIRNTVFRGNSSARSGGALYSWSPMSIENCVFENNRSDETGGAVRNHSGSTLTITSSLFDNNSAAGLGGAIYNNNSELMLSNVTFVNNRNTAIVFNFGASSSTVYNSIFLNNEGAGALNADIAAASRTTDLSGLSVRNNSLQDYTDGQNNLLGVDPLFVDPLAGDYRLRNASPAVDAGANGLFNQVSSSPAAASTDLDGEARIFNNTIDLGAYENTAPVEAPIPPTCTTITAPSDNAENVDLNPTITWQAATGAEGYYLSVGTSSGGTQILDREEVAGTSYALTESLEENTTYFITVIPFNEAGEAAGCNEVSFTTETLLSPPDCISIIFPSNNATDVDLTPTITWQAATGVEGYYLSVGTSPGGTQILDREEVAGTDYGLTEALEENTAYFVTVIPFNEAGEAEGCNEISFTTASTEEPTLPSCTVITAPSHESTGINLNPTISWQAAVGAEGYYLSVGTSPGGTQILDREEVIGTSYALTESLEENTTYFITVIPFNEAGEAAGCDEVSFTTETLLSPPDCTTITAPSNNAENVDLNPTITWQTAAGAEGYYLSLGTSPGGTQILDREEVTGTSYALTEALEENTVYFVTVIPFNEAGEAEGCNEISFTTASTTGPTLPDCATISSPSDNSENVNLTPTLTWQAAVGAEGYYLSVGTSPGGTQILDREEVTGTSYALTETLEENTVYYITVIPFNEVGEAAGCTEISFTTASTEEPTLPSCTVITAPSHESTGINLNPTISWQAAVGAEGYYLSVGTSPGGTQILDREEVAGTDYVLTESLEENTVYFVTVIPFNEVGEAEGCDEISFTTASATEPVLPDCTTISSPSDNSENVNLTPTLTWQTASGAEGYYLSLGTSSGRTQILDREEVTGTSYALTETLEENTVYFVTVIPFNEVGEAEGCEEISFTTASTEEPTIPSCTVITAPSHESTDINLNPTISWQAAVGAEGYYLSLGTSPGRTQILDREEVAGTSYALTETLEENTVYYITVIPFNEVGEAQGCDEISFTTASTEEPTLPSCTTISYPAQGEENVSLSPTIIWEEEEEALWYYVSLGTSPGVSNILENQLVIGNTYTLETSLDENQQYVLSVIPFSAAGEAVGCSEISFLTRSSKGNFKTKYGISPNGDGINDFWAIEDIDNYPQNNVAVYSRWGDKVFETVNYDNQSNVFDGTANRLTQLGGSQLPSGTYFFEILLQDGNGQISVKGFLIIKR